MLQTVFQIMLILFFVGFFLWGVVDRFLPRRTTVTPVFNPLDKQLLIAEILSKLPQQQAQAQQVIVQNTLVIDEETKAFLQRIADALEDANTFTHESAKVSHTSQLEAPVTFNESAHESVPVNAKVVRNYLKTHTWKEAAIYFHISEATISRLLKKQKGKNQ